MLKAIVFDIDDTLYNEAPSFIDAFDDVFSFNILENQLTEMFHNYQQQLSIAAGNSNSQLNLNGEEINFHALHHTFKKFNLEGLTQGDALSFMSKFHENSSNIKLFPGLAAVFNELVTKYRLGIITNGSTSQQLAKIMKLRLDRWISQDEIITSEQAKVKKPDPRIFTMMNRKFDLRGSDMMYVGSSYQDDIVPAKKAGWETVWFNRHNSPIDNPNIIPDQTVCSLDQVKELLLEIAGKKQ